MTQRTHCPACGHQTSDPECPTCGWTAPNPDRWASFELEKVVGHLGDVEQALENAVEDCQ